MNNDIKNILDLEDRVVELTGLINTSEQLVDVGGLDNDDGHLLLNLFLVIVVQGLAAQGLCLLEQLQGLGVLASRDAGASRVEAQLVGGLGDILDFPLENRDQQTKVVIRNFIQAQYAREKKPEIIDPHSYSVIKGLARVKHCSLAGVKVGQDIVVSLVGLGCILEHAIVQFDALLVALHAVEHLGLKMAQIPGQGLALALELLAPVLDQCGAFVELVGAVEAVGLLKDKLALEGLVEDREGVGVALEADQGDGLAVQGVLVLGIDRQDYIL